MRERERDASFTVGYLGWWVDDIQVYTCEVPVADTLTGPSQDIAETPDDPQARKR